VNKVEELHLIAYRCLKCGHYTISKYDGITCAKCHGQVVPAGEATLADKNKYMTVNVSVKDTDIFKRIINMLREIADDARAPDWVKDKMQRVFEKA